MTTPAFPLPDPHHALLEPFWAAAAQRRLEMPRCLQCQRFNWYPAPTCAYCGNAQLRWTAMAPQARLFSWAVVQRALHSPYQIIAPYISALVEFDEAPGVRLVTRVIGHDADSLRVNQPLTVVFEDLGYPQLQIGILAPLVT